MGFGYVRVAAFTPEVKVADCNYNISRIKELLKEAYDNGVLVAVFPELCITGYTCGDLFLHDSLIAAARQALAELAAYTEQYPGMIAFIGLPYEHGSKLYNVMAAVSEGRILGLVTKKNLPNYGEFYEKRYFAEGFDSCVMTRINDYITPIGSRLLFSCIDIERLVIGAEICEDLWSVNPPSDMHALHGATLIVNASASDELVGKRSFRQQLVKAQSSKLIAGYVYAGAGEGESTQDVVFGGHNIIAENGTILNESRMFDKGMIMADIDIDRIVYDRRRINTWKPEKTDLPVEYEGDIYFDEKSGYTISVFEAGEEKSRGLLMNEAYKAASDSSSVLLRACPKLSFVPDEKSERLSRCEEILDIQTYGLKKRLEHTASRSAVVGISGGLDSTLALLVTVRAFDRLKLDRGNIVCVTMPCFGTTDRTYNNAVLLTRRLGCTLREINIKASVRQHFNDIGHDESLHDVTYENSQARERTQILMDIANQVNGLVIGTGDMSELALGWATYNGDHMSMYGVNASVPKTLVRHLVSYYADTCENNSLSEILRDVLDTPVSPELLPPDENGLIAQKTEDLVGPYELHDFFLYHMLRWGETPKKIYMLAVNAFKNEYDTETIYKWLRTFTWRFFAQQYKRSCLPDGPKVGSVAVSPRGDLRMPSDASCTVWMNELDEIKKEWL